MTRTHKTIAQLQENLAACAPLWSDLHKYIQGMELENKRLENQHSADSRSIKHLADRLIRTKETIELLEERNTKLDSSRLRWRELSLQESDKVKKMEAELNKLHGPDYITISVEAHMAGCVERSNLRAKVEAQASEIEELRAKNGRLEEMLSYNW